MSRHLILADDVGVTITLFERLVSGERPDNAAALSKARIALVQSVNSYIAHLGTIVRDGGADVRMQPWQEAYDRIVELRRRYSHHIGRFDASAIQTDWRGYQQACGALISDMRQHLDEVRAWKPID